MRQPGSVARYVAGVFAFVWAIGWGTAHADQRLYVTQFSAGQVSVVDLSSGMTVGSIAVGGAPWSIAITPAGSRAYVAHNSASNVSVIDTISGTVIGTIPVGGASNGIAISPDGSHAYVAVRGAGTMAVIDTASNTVTAAISIGGEPTGVTLTPEALKDPQAFALVYDEHYNSIFAYVFRRLGNYDLAKDVTAETFMKAFQNLERFRYEGEHSLFTWIKKIMENKNLLFTYICKR